MEKIGLDEEVKCYFGEQPTAAPGLFRILDKKAIQEVIGELGTIKLFPVTLNASKAKGASTSRPTLSTALSDPTANLAFSNISKETSSGVSIKSFQ